MTTEASLEISRRLFPTAGGTAAAACFVPSRLVAKTEGRLEMRSRKAQQQK